MSLNLAVLEKLQSHLSTGWRHLRQCYWLLLIPAAVCVVLAIAYLLLMPQSWKASQSLIVRDDLLGEAFKPGRFTSQETQKNAQETILHMARNPSVIRAALESVGPLAKSTRRDWIDDQLIEDTKDSISIVAPNGAEFGKTDVVVLAVKAAERSRARVFVEALADEIETHLRKVRQDQLLSMQEELRLSVQQIGRQYDLVADKISQIESNAGSDLPTLRSLLDRTGSSNDIQRSLEQVRQERRAAETELEVATKQLELLQNIQSDPQQFAVSSNELLTMQPIFKRLREGLADAELKLMVDSGKYEPTHPAVVHGKEIVEQTKAQIQREASSFVQGLKHQQALVQQKLTRLIGVEREYDLRLVGLGKQRVEYEVLAREMEKRGESLGKAKTDLAEIQSLAESVEQVNLITRVGEAQVDLRPAGMSKKAILFLALLGGLAIGGAFVALLYDPSNLDPLSSRASTRKSRPSGKSQFANWFRTRFAKPAIESNTPTAEAHAAKPYGSGGASALRQASDRPRSAMPFAQETIATPSLEIDTGHSISPSDPMADGTVPATRSPSDIQIAQDSVKNDDELTTLRPEQSLLLGTLQLQDAILQGPLGDPVLDSPEPSGLTSPAPQPTEFLVVGDSVGQPTPANVSAKKELRDAPLVPNQTSPLQQDRFGNRKQRGTVQRTVDLDDLKRTLAEAAAQSRPGEEDSAALRARLEALSAEKERKRTVTQRLSDLSQTISAYCEPVRKKKPNDSEKPDSE